MMKRLKSGLLRTAAWLLLSVLLCPLFAGCFDLGDYGDAEDGDYSAYYDAFGDVVAIYGTGKHTYGVEASLFNTATVNDMTWDTENGGVEVLPEDYIYLALPFRETMSVESLTLYLRAEGDPEGNVTGEIRAFLLDSDAQIPEKIRKRGDPLFEEIEDVEAPGGKRQQEIDYDDPDVLSAVASKTKAMPAGVWTDFTLSGWKTTGGMSAEIRVNAGNVLLLRIENNTGYGEETLSPVTFRFMNLLVCRAD